MKTAIRDDIPVVFFLSTVLHPTKGAVPEEEYTIPFGEAAILRKGKDLTIVATGCYVSQALRASSECLDKRGYSAEVIDVRTLVPLDNKTILDSVKKTGRLVVVDEAHRTCGLASEIAAMVAEKGFEFLRAPIRRVTTLDAPIPASRPLADYIVPNKEKITKAVEDVLAYRRGSNGGHIS
jgi:pyruvate/2-oxoglutarate/acetoin dehydrogenase E1 component